MLRAPSLSRGSRLGPPLSQLQQAFQGGDDRATTWFSHYRQAESMAWAVEARKTLADPKLPAASKGQLRAQLAAFCSMMAEPDFNTRAIASHQGNPSMPVNRFFALPFAAVLIPDHQQAKTWLDTTREYVQYKAGMNVAPGGGYSELMTYYMAGAPTYVHGALVLKETGRLDDATRQIALGPVNFALAALPPPDPRFGFRVIPGFGHEGVLRGDPWRPAAALVKDVDPERADVYAWAWKEQDALAEVADGPYDLTFSKTNVAGVADGPARLIHLSKPAGLNVMPGVTIDGIRYAPGGYSGSDATFCKHLNPYSAIIPLRGGRQTFTLENLKQPAVFRYWNQWVDGTTVSPKRSN